MIRGNALAYLFKVDASPLYSCPIWSAIARSTSVMSVVSDRPGPPLLVGLGWSFGYIGGDRKHRNVWDVAN